GRRLLHAQRREPRLPAGPDLPALSPRGHPAAAAGQAARHPPQRLDDHRRRDRLPGPPLRRPLPHHPHGPAHLPPRRSDARPAAAAFMTESVELAPGYRVSRLLKGGWQLSEGHGAPVETEAAIEGMIAFAEAGVTGFDCADIYTGVEELIGAFRA